MSKLDDYASRRHPHFAWEDGELVNLGTPRMSDFDAALVADLNAIFDRRPPVILCARPTVRRVTRRAPRRAHRSVSRVSPSSGDDGPPAPPRRRNASAHGCAS